MKSPSYPCLKLALFLLTYLPVSSAYTFEGYQIRDLEYEGAQFIQEASAWSVPPAKVIYGTDIGTCAGYTIIGGYNTVDQYTTWTRVYDNLPAHNTIYFSIHIWLIDSWDLGDTFWIQFDIVQLSFWNNIYHENFPSGRVCGLDGWNDIPNLELNGQVAHTGSSLTLQIISGLDSASRDESLGFRDFTFLFATTSSPTTSYCSNMTLPGQPYTCQCAPNQYLDTSNNCQDCGQACQSCFGASSDECYSCNNGYFYDGTHCEECDDSCDGCFGATSTKCYNCKNGYFYDGTSCEICDPSCNGCTGGSTSADCNACKSGYFYNGAYCQQCDDACDGCSGPSSANCDTCKNGYFDNAAYCEPCHLSCKTCFGNSNEECTACKTGYSLFLDTVCTNSCPVWFSTSSDANTEYCDAVCPNNGYLNKDFSCTNTCNVPYKVSKKGRYKYCIKICSSNSEYYFRKTSTCVTTCPSSYYGSDTSLMCEACQDPLCAICSGSSGETCSQCKSGAILDNDGKCKECEAMNIEYIQTTDSASQYRITLSPETCDLTLTYVKSNLAATKESKAKFPSFTFTTTAGNSRTYLLTITLRSTLLESTNMNITLNYLNDMALVPKQFIPSTTLAALAAAAPAAATMLTGTFGVSFAGTLSIGAAAALWSMINYQQFIGNLIFVNIDYPFQLELFLSLLQSVGLEILPNPLTKLSNQIDEHFPQFKGDINAEKYNPPAKFVKYNKTSFFIENGGTSFAMNFCFLVLMGIIPLLMKLRRFPGRSKLAILAFHLKWNINARSFLENGIPITLAFCLQIRRTTFTTPYNIISMIFAILALIYSIVMMDFLLRFLASNDNAGLFGVFTKAKFGTLYEGVKLQRPIAKYYHFLILFRGMLLAFLVSFFEDWPVFQVLPLVFYNIMMVIFLFKGIEFTDRKLLFINRSKEICITLGLCGVIALNVRVASEKYYEILGWIIVSVFVVSFLAEFFYTIALQVKEFRHLYLKLRASSKGKIKRLSAPRPEMATLEYHSSPVLTTLNDTSMLDNSRVGLKRKFNPHKRRRLSSAIEIL